MKYLAIEGSSYVGKTTVIDRFSKEGCPIIPEYDAFGAFLPGGDTYESLKNAALDIVDRERKRTIMLARAAERGITLSDRSPLSLVTYEDMMIEVAETPEKKQLRKDMRSFIVDTLQEEVEAGDIVLPDAIITLRIDSEDEFNSRVRHRGITPVQHLARFSIQQLIASRTLQYSQVVLSEDSTGSIDVSGHSEDSTFRQVNNLAEQLQSNPSPANLNKIKGL